MNGFNWIAEVLHGISVHYLELEHLGERISLFYRQDYLEKTLSRMENRCFLDRFGYHPENDLARDLNRLRIRFIGPFPHEIGIFLGIPVDDVTGFLANQGKKYLLAGYWKVYHNLEGAIEKFADFDRAKKIAGYFLVSGLC